MKVPLPEEIEKHRVTAWVREHRTLTRILAAVAITLLLVGACTLARSATVVAPTITCAIVGGQVACSDGALTPPVVVPPPVVIPPVVNCPAGTVVHDGGGQDMILMFGQGQFHVFRFTVPANAPSRVKTSQFAPHLGGGTFAWSVSERACDTSPANAVELVGGSGTVYPNSKSAGASGSGWSFNVKPGGNVFPGKTYFINVQATDCGSCGLIANVVLP